MGAKAKVRWPVHQAEGLPHPPGDRRRIATYAREQRNQIKKQTNKKGCYLALFTRSCVCGVVPRVCLSSLSVCVWEGAPSLPHTAAETVGAGVSSTTLPAGLGLSWYAS